MNDTWLTMCFPMVALCTPCSRGRRTAAAHSPWAPQPLTAPYFHRSPSQRCPPTHHTRSRSQPLPPRLTPLARIVSKLRAPPPGKDAEHHKFGGWVAESKATQERRRRDTYEREEIDAHKMAIAAATAASDTAMTAAGGIDARESTRKRSSIFSLLSS